MEWHPLDGGGAHRPENFHLKQSARGYEFDRHITHGDTLPNIVGKAAQCDVADACVAMKHRFVMVNVAVVGINYQRDEVFPRSRPPFQQRSRLSDEFPLFETNEGIESRLYRCLTRTKVERRYAPA